MNPGLYWKRLFASLMVSCLVHAALIYLPYLGASMAVSPSEQGGLKQGRSRVLNATLTPQRGPAAAVAATSATGASATAVPKSSQATEEPSPAADQTKGVDIVPIPAPIYYTADQLTKRPQPISAPRLDTPEIGLIFTSGSVILKLWINELGDVISVDIEESDVPEAIAASAVAAFKTLRFAPGEINGRPVGALMRIEVTYNEDGMMPP
jgi:TonB family protein